MNDGVFEVLSTSGNTFLGGEDFDERIMSWMAGQFLADTGIDLRQDRLALAAIERSGRARKVRTVIRYGNEHQPAVHRRGRYRVRNTSTSR